MATTSDKGRLVGLAVRSEALERAHEPRRFALVVGVGELRDDRWRPLKFATKDAEDFGSALRDEKRGAFTEVHLLTRPEQTTTAAILESVRALNAKATRPDDVVVVYVSAHGTLARDEGGELRRYLVTHDADFRRVAETALSMDELRLELERLTSRRRLLVLATCHSGSGKSLLPDDIRKELEGIKASRPLVLEEASRASMVLSASDFGETAREDERLVNDIYTHFFVEALSGKGDRNGDGAVSATEAHDWSRRRTYAFTGGRQRPSAEILEVGADPIVLSGRIERAGQPELYSYNARLDGSHLKVDGEERAELPGGAAVAPGRHKIELTKGGAVLFSSELSVGPGDRIELSELLLRSSPHRVASVTVGAIGFADGRDRAELSPPFALYGLALRVDGVPWPRFSLSFDASGAMGRNALSLDGEPVSFSYQAVHVGGALYWASSAGRFRLLVGPRVASLYLSRSFALETYRAVQGYFSIAPGVTAAAAFSLGDRFELSTTMNAMLTYVMVDGSGRLAGFAGLQAGAGWRF